MNKLTIIGNLTSDPEIREIYKGQETISVCNFSVAVNRHAYGQRMTDYFRVNCWRKQAENAMKYLSKGRKVAVTGIVTAHGYLGNDGTPKASMQIYADDVEYLSSKQDEQQDVQSTPQPDSSGFTQVDTEELPF